MDKSFWAQIALWIFGAGGLVTHIRGRLKRADEVHAAIIDTQGKMQKLILKTTERISDIEDWKIGAGGRNMACKTAIHREMEDNLKIVDRRADGIVREIDGIKSSVRVHAEKHKNMRIFMSEFKKEIKSDFSTLNDNVMKALTLFASKK